MARFKLWLLDDCLCDGSVQLWRNSFIIAISNHQIYTKKQSRGKNYYNEKDNFNGLLVFPLN